MGKKIDCARSGAALVFTIIGIVVSIVLAVGTYNTRYDSSAQASGELVYSFSTDNNSGSATLTASAGSVWYGAWQKTGTSGSSTSYTMYYKKTSASKYDTVRNLSFKYNGVSYRKGDWRLARSRNSQKYDVKIRRTSNKTTKSSLAVDWAVDSYNSTGS